MGIEIEYPTGYANSGDGLFNDTGLLRVAAILHRENFRQPFLVVYPEFSFSLVKKQKSISR